MISPARFAACVWRRRWWILAAIVLGMLVTALDAHAQTGTWVAEEEEWRDYLILSEDVLILVRIDERGKCVGAPMPVTIEGDTLRRQKGEDWHLKVKRGKPDTLRVTAPSFEREFARTLYNPIERCSQDDSEI
jgi:hypothetical protein